MSSPTGGVVSSSVIQPKSAVAVSPALLSVKLPEGDADEQVVANSQTVRWVRRALAVAVPLVALNSIFTAFADNMPAEHHIGALVAAPVFVGAWILALSSVRWPRLALIAAMVVPNLWLTLIGHTETNLLFLPLTVGWVAYVGTRTEGLIALVLALAIIAIGQLFIVAPNIGGIPWESWTEWSFILLLTWFMGASLRKQERLVIQLDQRSHELAMLLGVSRSVASTLQMEPLLDTVFNALDSVVQYSAAAVLTLNEARDMLAVARLRAPEPHASRELQRVEYPVAELGAAWDRLRLDEPVVVSDVRGLSTESGLLRHVADDEHVYESYGVVRSLMWIPLVVRQQITGVLAIANASPDAFDDRHATLALGIARQAAVAIDNARLHERARQAAVLEERQRLSRELHDSVAQSLYGISLYAEAAGRALTGGRTEPAIANLHDISDTAQEALGEMRLLLFELRPPLLQERGLAAALRARLQAVETRAGVVSEFACDGDPRLAPDQEQELYRLAQEALNNVLKHAHATRVAVRFAVLNSTATLEIADDGMGFEPSLRAGDGFGLPGMQERVERLGGKFSIASSPGAGTRVLVEVPT